MTSRFCRASRNRRGIRTNHGRGRRAADNRDSQPGREKANTPPPAPRTHAFASAVPATAPRAPVRQRRPATGRFRNNDRRPARAVSQGSVHDTGPDGRGAARSWAGRSTSMNASPSPLALTDAAAPGARRRSRPVRHPVPGRRRSATTCGPCPATNAARARARSMDVRVQGTEHLEQIQVTPSVDVVVAVESLRSVGACAAGGCQEAQSLEPLPFAVPAGTEEPPPWAFGPSAPPGIGAGKTRTMGGERQGRE